MLPFGKDLERKNEKEERRERKLNILCYIFFIFKNNNKIALKTPIKKKIFLREEMSCLQRRLHTLMERYQQ